MVGPKMGVLLSQSAHPILLCRRVPFSSCLDEFRFGKALPQLLLKIEDCDFKDD